MSKLVLFTKRYPYFKTEAFLETEIPILAALFEEIIIVPTEVSDEKRIVPLNVTVNEDFSKLFKKDVYRVILGLFSLLFWKSFLINLSKIKNISTFFMLFKFCSKVLLYNQFIKKNKKLFQNVDFCYSYWFTESTYSMVYSKKKFNFKYKSLTRIHRFDLYEGLESTQAFWPFRQENINYLQRIFSISQDGIDYLKEKYRVQNQISIARLGVLNQNDVTPRSDYGHISFVSVSRIEKLKRVDLIWEVIEKLSILNPNLSIKWTHFGDGSLFEDLKNRVYNKQNLSVELKGYVPNSIVYDFYKNNKVDIFINLSTSEGIPVSIMEAISYGIQIIATDVGGTREIVTNQSGILISPDPSLDEILNSIYLLLDSPLSQSQIIDFWDKNYNAKINYANFAKEIISIT